jgi:succinoglycan biosynthesis protein ExoM
MLTKASVVRPGHQAAVAASSSENGSGIEAAELEVSIVIPTFQRPDDLRNVLRSCLAQRADSGQAFEIVVVDNSPDGSAALVVAGLEPGIIPVRYVHEPRPGISRARNAGFTCARGRFLALIDDDEQASPDWLAHLTRAQRTCGADVVFGPVYPEFDPAPERHLRFLKRFYTYTLNRPTGSPVGARSTNNALVRRDCLRTPEPFAVDLGLIGGEDTLFFSQLRVHGARFVWCAEGFVTERIPPERTRWSFVWRRSFQRGQCRASTPMLLDPPRRMRTAFWMVVGAVQFLGLLPAVCGLWLVDRQRALYCAWKMLGGLGKVLWMSRFRWQAYRRPASSAAPQL